MKRLSIIVAATLLAGAAASQSIKFNVQRKASTKAGRPSRIVHTNDTELVYTLASDFQAFLAGLTRSGSIEMDVDTAMEYWYSADFYMGSNKQALNFQLDTGSNMLVMQSSACT